MQILLRYLEDVKKGSRGKLINRFILKNKHGFLYKFFKKIYYFLMANVFKLHNANKPGLDNDNIPLFCSLFNKISAKNNHYHYIPGFVILVNATLASGGAERQVINTLVGLKNQGWSHLLLLCENLNPSMGLDFYLPILKKNNVPVELVKNTSYLDDNVFGELKDDVEKFLKLLPLQLSQEILNLYYEFKERQPETVHAWQDSTATKVGIAAVLAGVPRIILGTRNVVPIHFSYYKPYMFMIYKALATLDKIVWVNNSLVGAIDYANWLGFSQDRFIVVRNGVDFQNLKRIPDEQCIIEKTKLGIPASAKIIGSIFRFYPEKNPLLWVETAVKLLKEYSGCYVLLAGDGPLKKEMQVLIHKNNLQDRFIFMGEQKDIALILSLLDVFLLTSTFEGTPNVVLEAEWMGVPVVAVKAGGTAEAMLDGVTGFVTDVAEPTHLASLVGKILQDTMFHKQVALEGPKFIRDHYSLDLMIKNTMGLY